MEVTVLYRYELTHDFNRTHIYPHELEVISETPCEYWVKIKWGRKKWVSKNARNSYAQTTEREALKHFVRRKTYRNVCIQSELERNDVGIRTAKELIKKNDKQGKR